MFLKKINIWYLSSFVISLIVAIPILTVFSSFFDTTGNYSSILKNSFLYDYIFNSLILLTGVLMLTFLIGVTCAYLVSFYNFPGVSFFKWALILSFAVPAYIYAYSLTAFFENYGTAFSILKIYLEKLIIIHLYLNLMVWREPFCLFHFHCLDMSLF